MASARYTLNIRPEDLEPESPRELTKKEKAANWWHYHWGYVAAGAVLLAVLAWALADVLGKETPDYQLALVSERYIPEQVTAELESALAVFGRDLNGDGETLVWVMDYQLDFGAAEGEDPEAELAVDPMTQMAGTTRLMGDVQAGESLVFLTDDPAAFQRTFLLLESADPDSGSLEGAALYAAADCPALAGLELSAEARAVLEELYIAKRGFAEGEGLANWPAENEAFFEAMVAGAPAADTASVP